MFIVMQLLLTAKILYSILRIHGLKIKKVLENCCQILFTQRIKVILVKICQ